MEKRYKQLRLEDRDRITEMTAEGRSITEIAEALGRHKSTISREVRGNSSPAYRLYLSHRAHERSVKRKQEANSHPRLKTDGIISYVRSKLDMGWSPEQISGRIGLDCHGLSISHEAVYQYIYDKDTADRDELIKLLRRRHRKRRAKGVSRKERKTKIPNRVSIQERPASVETRNRFGHWEGDSLVSRKSAEALNTLVERKSRLVFITRLQRKTAEESCFQRLCVFFFTLLTPIIPDTNSFSMNLHFIENMMYNYTSARRCYMARMIRKQIYIEQEQENILKKRARILRKAESELVREGINMILLRQYALKDSNAWKKERMFIQSLIEKGPAKGKRQWTREDLYDRKISG